MVLFVFEFFSGEVKALGSLLSILQKYRKCTAAVISDRVLYSQGGGAVSPSARVTDGVFLAAPVFCHGYNFLF